MVSDSLTQAIEKRKNCCTAKSSVRKVHQDVDTCCDRCSYALPSWDCEIGFFLESNFPTLLYGNEHSTLPLSFHARPCIGLPNLYQRATYIFCWPFTLTGLSGNGDPIVLYAHVSSNSFVVIKPTSSEWESKAKWIVGSTFCFYRSDYAQVCKYSNFQVLGIQIFKIFVPNNFELRYSEWFFLQRWTRNFA